VPPSVATCTLLALAVALGPCPTQAAEPAPAPGTNPDLPVEPPPPLHRDPHEETAVRRALSLGAGISGAGLVVGGLLLWRRGRRDFASDIAGLDQPILPLPAGQDRYYAVDTLLLDTRTQWIGISLATSGLGAGAVAITEAAGGGQRALLTEFGLGAAFTGGGALAIQSPQATARALGPRHLGRPRASPRRDRPLLRAPGRRRRHGSRLAHLPGHPPSPQAQPQAAHLDRRPRRHDLFLVFSLLFLFLSFSSSSL
jgi:hypothetical protein